MKPQEIIKKQEEINEDFKVLEYRVKALQDAVTKYVTELKGGQ